MEWRYLPLEIEIGIHEFNHRYIQIIMIKNPFHYFWQPHSSLKTSLFHSQNKYTLTSQLSLTSSLSVPGKIGLTCTPHFATP